MPVLCALLHAWIGMVVDRGKGERREVPLNERIRFTAVGELQRNEFLQARSIQGATIECARYRPARSVPAYSSRSR